jgi:hypothetical protein
MARVKFGPNITSIDGKLGGTVFTKGRSVHALRTKVVPRNPRSSGQVSIRSLVGGYSAAFRALTAANIIAWNTAAAAQTKSNHYGDKYHPTGHKYFIAQNTINSEFGNGVEITTPQVPVAPAQVGCSAFNAVIAGTVVTITTDDAVGANTILAVYATEQMSAGISNAKGKFRFIKQFPGGTAAGALDISTEYIAKFGTLTLDKKIFVKTKLTNVHATVKSTLYGNNGELSGKVRAT